MNRVFYLVSILTLYSGCFRPRFTCVSSKVNNVESKASGFREIGESNSDEVKLTGWVLDSMGGYPLSGAVVRISRDSIKYKGALTDENGKFIIHQLSGGNWNLKVDYIEFNSLFDTLLLDSGKIYEIKITLGLRNRL